MPLPSPSDVFREVPYLADLAEPTLSALAEMATCRDYVAGEVIFWEGDPVAGLYIIGDGYVKICRHSVDGREHILHLLHRGETFNDVAALDGGMNPATAVAHTDAAVWRIPRPELMQAAAQHADLAWALLESMASRARYLVMKVEDLSMRSVRGRVARLLQDQAAQNADAAVPRLLTQEEMANQLGTVREMVGRALRSLADEGIIEFDRHRIVILDPDQLAQAAIA